MEISKGDVEQILAATVLNMNGDDIRVSKMAVCALKNVLPLAGSNFSAPEQRQLIMDNLIRAATLKGREELNEYKQLALEAL